MTVRIILLVALVVFPIPLIGQYDIDSQDFNIRFTENKEPQTSPLWFVFVFIGLGIFLYIKFFTNLIRSKDDLTFTSNSPPTRRNVRYAYKVIGYYLLYSENDDLRGQYKYLIAYLRNLFPQDKSFDAQEFADIRHEFDSITIPILWLKRVLQKDQYPQVIDFMIDLAFYNGKVSRGELFLIYQAGKLLRFTESEVKAIIAMRQNHYKEQEQKKRDNRSESFSNSINRSTKKNSSLKILGLPNTTTDLKEVRKAYRDLARKYHPDRFVNSEKGEQKMAHERFVQINNAHDFLQTSLVQ